MLNSRVSGAFDCMPLPSSKRGTSPVRDLGHMITSGHKDKQEGSGIQWKALEKAS